MLARATPSDAGLRVLYAEDSDNDVLLVVKAFAMVAPHTRVQHVQDGSEALRYLRRKGKYQDRRRFPSPQVVLSDLKMPRLDGFALLQELKAEPSWASIPVVIFSSSYHPGDVGRAYDLGAAAFAAKPSEFSNLLEFARAFEHFWRICRLPGHRRADEPSSLISLAWGRSEKGG